MDVLPAHLNRDSFRDSFKGLVALEIIIDLPIGFPIDNIISLSRARYVQTYCLFPSAHMIRLTSCLLTWPRFEV